MKAAIFKAPGEALAIEQVAEPQPGPGDLILAVRACGICGSDLHMSEVHDTAGGMSPLPAGAVMGHEFAGEVVEVGPEARSNWRTGERATALPFIGCGRCAACLCGRGYRCPQVAFNGLGRLAGAYAEYVRVAAHEALRLPEAMSFRQGALVEPLAVGLHAVRRSRLAAGQSVLVVGAGPVGLAVALWCRFFGARHVVASDRVSQRAGSAARFGATDWIDAGREDVVGRFKQAAGARPDLVFDCVGAPGSHQLAMDYAPTDGRVVVVGVCMQRDSILPVKAVTKELEVVYSFMYERRDFSLAIEMLARERVRAEGMFSHAVGFEAFPAAFEALKRPQDQIKVMLEPD